MSAMEKSLRRALEAGDAGDPAFRESIYAASERALERMLAQKPVEEAVAHMQRTRLAETINRVEDDFYARQTEAGAAADGPAQHDPALSLDPAYRDAHAYATHDADETDDVRSSDARTFDLQPVFEGAGGDRRATGMAAAPADAAGTAAVEPIHPSPHARAAEAARKATQRSNAQLRRFVLIALAVAAVLAAGIYFVYASASSSEPASGATDGAWIDLFDGKRLDALATPQGGRVEALGEDQSNRRPAVRFTPSGDAASLNVAVGDGVARSVDGRKVVVELAAGSPDGTARTFAVECRLGGRSVCGRQNFATSRSIDTFVFDMDVPAGARGGDIALFPTEPSAAGLTLYAMRLRHG